MTLIWFIVWMVNGHPWLMTEWNPWNIALLVCAAFDFVGLRLGGVASRPRRTTA